MMFTWIFYVLVLSALIALFSVMFGHFFGGDNLIPAEVDAGLESAARIDANAAAVSDNRFDNISFDVVLRGYRQDQVDAVIENMRQRIIALENLTGTKEKG
ncbi:DivIVA domain-containing protein [Corynebacterium durum]|jgi:divIVA domain protein|uniref:DivIVA domain-containing protein n=1 Tax=Corynebacterium durum TaxID=61592 RepID=UPI0028EB430F|nr:DivIVA domain-containing protein [Corynebacterium durum]